MPNDLKKRDVLSPFGSKCIYYATFFLEVQHDSVYHQSYLR